MDPVSNSSFNVLVLKLNSSSLLHAAICIDNIEEQNNQMFKIEGSKVSSLSNNHLLKNIYILWQSTDKKTKFWGGARGGVVGG